MSHFSTLHTKLTNAEILVKSLKDLGFVVTETIEGKRPYVRGYNGRTENVDIAVTLPGGYDLGFTKVDECYDTIGDLWGINKQHKFAELMDSVNQKYAVNKTLQEVQERAGLKNANVKLVLQ